jgi:hypothetical protein
MPRASIACTPHLREERFSVIDPSGKHAIHELYDVIALPGIRRPQAVGLKTDEIRRILTIED